MSNTATALRHFRHEQKVLV
jgi:chromosome segregation ATPase